VFPDGTEKGWQVKFYAGMNADPLASLDDSVETALTKHPQLTQYTVRLPFDLVDPRRDGAKTALAKWTAWRERWEGKARLQGRRLEISLRDAVVIKQLLSSNDSIRAGRVLFWFNEEVLTPEWVRAKLERMRAELMGRYTAETNVELPIHRALLALARDTFLETDVQRRLETVLDHTQADWGRCSRQLGRDFEGAMQAIVTELTGWSPAPWVTVVVPRSKRPRKWPLAGALKPLLD
jgi:hypothetical protein